MDFKREKDPSSLVRDTRKPLQKLGDNLTDPIFLFMLMGALAAFGFSFYSMVEVFCGLSLAVGAWGRYLIKRQGLPLRVPKSSGLMDPNERSLKDGKPTKAEGIIYLGNDQETDEEVWLTDSQARTHMLVMGTTGSGKTEMLLSTVSNALIHGSGLIYVDGKADSSLYAKIYSMARQRGREDDVLVINFQTGARDVFGAQPHKMSNTLNPFAVGSAGMLTQLVVSLMSSGKGDMWENRAISFVEALLKPLVFLREKHGFMLDVTLIRDYFNLPMLEELAWKMSDQYDGLEPMVEGLQNYLKNLPTYDRNKFKNQSDTANEQHGYITMQLIRTFNSLADTYGYIMKTQLAEIDFLDVLLNRRILVVLLPALEKSPAELTNLGRIIVASIKATMAVGLGARIEGDWDDAIESKPTNSPSPFMCVLDEYGYYAVEGFAVVAAQARSLGFMAIFAGQDLPSFQRASEKEAESTIANTNTKICGKMSCVKTYKYFSDVAGQGYFTRQGAYVGDETSLLGGRKYREGDNASIEKFERVTLDALQKQRSGQWHLFFEGKIIRMRSFFADFSKKGGRNVSELRVNHFVRAGRPSAAAIEAQRRANAVFDDAMAQETGFDALIDTHVVRELSLLAEGFKKYGPGGNSMVAALQSIAMGFQVDNAAHGAMQNMLDMYKSGGDAHFDASGSGNDSPIDVTSGLQGFDDARPDRHESRLEVTNDEFPEAFVEPSPGLDDSIPSFQDDFEPVRMSTEKRRIFESVGVEKLSGAAIFGFNPDEGDEPPTGSEALSQQTEAGILDRDTTIEGLALVQERLGDTPEEAALAASVVVSEMSRNTTYSPQPPINAQTPEEVIDLVLQIKQQICELDTKEEATA